MEFPLKDFIAKNNLQNDQNAATLLIVALAPHATPELFDNTLQEKIKRQEIFLK